MKKIYVLYSEVFSIILLIVSGYSLSAANGDGIVVFGAATNILVALMVISFFLSIYFGSIIVWSTGVEFVLSASGRDNLIRYSGVPFSGLLWKETREKLGIDGDRNDLPN